ncbi:EamA family transporter [Novacetimonas maltaceti]|nr:DMT family transporter [Novacetimonas maltaceti]PYD60027.1 EamA family transporter [Novacetimonas maltaceti]
MQHVTPTLRPAPFALSRQEAALVGVTMIWGTTFLIVHLAMQSCGPLFFVAVRFLAAGGASLLVFHKAMRALTLRELGAGIAIGISIFMGYSLQTYGLQTITSSQSAFITAMYVPMVPLLQWVVLRRMPHLMNWIGISLAFAGLLLLAGPDAGAGTFSRGEAATLLGTVAIASEIILISRFATQVDSRRVTVVQLLAAGVLAFATMPLGGEALPHFSWIWLVCGGGLGIASALIQLTMNWAQKAISPTRATVIYAGEPVWAGILGRIAGERLPPLALLGAVFIIAGVVVGEWRPRGRRVVNDGEG